MKNTSVKLPPCREGGENKEFPVGKEGASLIESGFLIEVVSDTQIIREF